MRLKILDAGEVVYRDEARHLSQLFWRSVNAAIAEEKEGKNYRWSEGAEFWTEKLIGKEGQFSPCRISLFLQ
jgi:hypothetical protein